MIESNHKIITRAGLKGVGLKPNAIELIVGANKEADYLIGEKMAHHPPQHFQGPTEGSDFTDSKSFYDGALRLACYYVVTGKEKNINRSFYFLGRALHCIQDFYAHTNWVARGNMGCWNEKKVAGLKLSICTPDFHGQDNGPWHKSKLFPKSEKEWERLKEKREDWFKNMKTEKLTHPDMHLDFRSSFASKICKEFLPSKKLGYDMARGLATTHTKKAWNDFLRRVKSFAGSAKDAKSLADELMGHNPKYITINWLKHRYAFAKAAKSGFLLPHSGISLKYI